MTLRFTACRLCGCTETTACLTEAGPCWWVEPDLCSACEPAARRARGAGVIAACVAVMAVGALALSWIIAAAVRRGLM